MHLIPQLRYSKILVSHIGHWMISSLGLSKTSWTELQFLANQNQILLKYLGFLAL